MDFAGEKAERNGHAIRNSGKGERSRRPGLVERRTPPWSELRIKMRNRRLLFLFVLSVFSLRLAFPASQVTSETYLERQTNERQPPGKVLAAIGVKPGMVIGEVGAGRGRYTVHLARGVGETGKIYANDINPKSLEYLRLRCQQEGINNVETIVGEVDDPLFPNGALDMAFMVLTYHHLAKPVDLLKNLIPSLKPSATIVIIDPDPVKDEDRAGHESTSVEQMRRDALSAGLGIVRIETFLEKDNIFILRPIHQSPEIATARWLSDALR